jgi:hypothetical protein
MNTRGEIMAHIIHYNRSGIPILEDREIEEMAYDFVSHVDDTSLKTPCIAPIAGILDYMESAYKVRMSFHNLGNLDGYKILGKTVFPANRIYIDMDIIYRQESLFFFTVAHSIGHWALHARQKIMPGNSNRILKVVNDCESDFWGKRGMGTLKDEIEHQANVFAASLLMPRSTLVTAIMIKQLRMGITRKAGNIYLNRSKSSIMSFHEIVSYLENIFGMSKQLIILRLKTLELLHISEEEEDKNILYTYIV